MSQHDYELVIGLEIHVELATKTKIFCSCENVFGGEENSHCCPVCLGLPGTLPVLNTHVVDYAVKAGLALNCQIAPVSYMDRKNYHYPDLPKAYQISQRNVPICSHGHVDLEDEDGSPFTIGITEIHMEEDAGKLVHLANRPFSRADYNRAAVPLIEIVTEPDFRSASQVRAFLQTLRDTLVSLGVSDCKMEEGSMRCDVNISVRKKGETGFGTRTETKNVNSFRSIGRVIDYESNRQIKRLEAGEPIIQQTMHWDDAIGKTSPMRDKENSHDYRYFPEPDLPPVVVDQARLARLKAEMPELPEARRKRYEMDFVMNADDARMIANTPWMAQLFDGAMAANADAKLAVNWIIGPLVALYGDKAAQGEALLFDGKQYAEFIGMVAASKINSSAAKTVLETMVSQGGDPQAIVQEKGLAQMDDRDALLAVAREVVAENPNAVKDYLGGKEKALTSLQGAAMKKTRGKANPKLIRELILSLIQSES